SHIQAQALSAKLRPILTRVSPTSRSRGCSDSSGKQWRRLVRTTSRERFGSFHMSQPTKAPTRCAAPNGSHANSLSDPTTIAPLSFSPEHTPLLPIAPWSPPLRPPPTAGAQLQSSTTGCPALGGPSQ